MADQEIYIEGQKRMLFLLDYGDEWHFIVNLKEIRPPEGATKHPRVLESCGETPPQDGYNEVEE